MGGSDEIREESVKDACLVFVAQADGLIKNINEAKLKLMEATSALTAVEATLTTITRHLGRLKVEIEAQKGAAAAKLREAYGWGVTGLLLGPLGLVVTEGIIAGVIEGKAIPDIVKAVDSQVHMLDQAMMEFKTMGKEAESMRGPIEEKTNQLIEINARLKNAKAVVASTAQYVSPLMIKLAIHALTELADYCEKSLG